MPFYQAGGIKYYKFSSLEIPGIYHAFFTRLGGVSPEPWESLNLGASVGDNLDRVKQNREKALSAVGLDPQSVYEVYQVHSDKVVITDHPRAVNEPHIKADAIITSRLGVTLMMRFADCVPVLLFDPIQHAVGIVHAGWSGTVHKIAAKTVVQMRQSYGSNPEDILAAIGPAIGPDHYQVGTEVIDIVEHNFQGQAARLISYINGRSYFDLWKANQLVLAEVGVKQVDIAGICTHCQVGDWYSHRAEHGKTGRFGVVVGLSA